MESRSTADAKTNPDSGSYSADPERYRGLVEALYEQHPALTLPPEYAYFIEKDLLRLLIRLARYKFLARIIKRSDRLLEIGCGSGLGSIFLSQHCERVVGLDVNSRELAEAHSINRRPNVEFKRGDVFELDGFEQFDIVLALDVIEHFPPERGRDLLAVMARQVKPAGMIVIGTPSIYSYPYQSALSKAAHVKCYDQEELLALVDDYFHRSIAFSMNDELVHTGFPKMAWYYFVLGFLPRGPVA